MQWQPLYLSGSQCPRKSFGSHTLKLLLLKSVFLSSRKLQALLLSYISRADLIALWYSTVLVFVSQQQLLNYLLSKDEWPVCASPRNTKVSRLLQTLKHGRCSRDSSYEAQEFDCLKFPVSHRLGIEFTGVRWRLFPLLHNCLCFSSVFCP